MTAETLSFDVIERRNGWCFRFPAGDEKALWFGPYKTRIEAEVAAAKIIEEYLAKKVVEAFGLSM